MSQFVVERKAAMLVSDFSPLRVPLQWVMDVTRELDKSSLKIAHVQVDAHNIVPCWKASDKLE